MEIFLKALKVQNFKTYGSLFPSSVTQNFEHCPENQGRKTFQQSEELKNMR